MKSGKKRKAKGRIRPNRSCPHRVKRCSECGCCSRCPSTSCLEVTHIEKIVGGQPGKRGASTEGDVVASKRPCRAGAAGKDYLEVSETSIALEKVELLSLGKQIQSAIASSLADSDGDVVDRLAKLDMSFLGTERHEVATRALLRRLLESIIDALGDDAATVNALRGLCAYLFYSESAELAPITPLLQKLADLAVRARDPRERRSLMRIIAGETNGNLALEIAHEKATLDFEFCAQAGGSWLAYLPPDTTPAAPAVVAPVEAPAVPVQQPVKLSKCSDCGALGKDLVPEGWDSCSRCTRLRCPRNASRGPTLPVTTLATSRAMLCAVTSLR